jgi:hypothetical protein
VGIHLWEAPSSSTNPDGGKKQILIVHIDDHSIFASSREPTASSTKTQQQPTVLKVGMRLVSVNGISVMSSTKNKYTGVREEKYLSVKEIDRILQNAVGCVTLLVSGSSVGVPDVLLPTSSCSMTHQAKSLVLLPHTVLATATMSDIPDGVISVRRLEVCQVTKRRRSVRSMVIVPFNSSEEQIPLLESLLLLDDGDDTTASSNDSSFTSWTGSATSSNTSCSSSTHVSTHANCNHDEDDDDDDSIHDTVELERNIRQIWSPILMDSHTRRR